MGIAEALLRSSWKWRQDPGKIWKRRRGLRIQKLGKAPMFSCPVSLRPKHPSTWALYTCSLVAFTPSISGRTPQAAGKWSHKDPQFPELCCVFCWGPSGRFEDVVWNQRSEVWNPRSEGAQHEVCRGSTFGILAAALGWLVGTRRQAQVHTSGLGKRGFPQECCCQSFMSTATDHRGCGP